jgi:hypothetical protein
MSDDLVARLRDTDSWDDAQIREEAADAVDGLQKALDWPWEHKRDATVQMLAAIVRDLAALRVTSDLLIECPCAIREHKPECPWRRAVEWVRGQETKT